MQDDYDKLLTATKELSKGNFDVEIDGDLGIFNALMMNLKIFELVLKLLLKRKLSLRI